MTEPIEPPRGRLFRLLFRGSSLGGLVLLFAYAATTLARSPCLGVADIQDFWRVSKPAGIEHLAPLEAPGYYVRCEFRTTESDLLSAPSSSALLAWLARFVPAQTSALEDGFSLRQVGLLYLALTTLILAAGLAAGVHPFLLLALAYVLADPGYLLFFNSFYADATLFVALLGTTLWMIRAGELPSPFSAGRLPIAIVATAILVALALLGGGSKMQYVLLPWVILAALAPLWIVGGRAGGRRTSALSLLLAFAALLVGWNFFKGPGPRFLEFNNYHAVYGGILRVATDPAKVLADLDVPQEFRDLPRTDAWSAQVGPDHPVHRHLRPLSRLHLLSLYLRDPQASIHILSAITTHLLAVESHPRGTYEKTPDDRGPVRRTYRVIWQFSRWTRELLALWRPAILAILFAGAFWLAAFARPGRWNGRRSALLFLLLWIVSQFVVAVLGEGLVNLHQHLVGARLGFDFLMVLLVADIAVELRSRLSH